MVAREGFSICFSTVSAVLTELIGLPSSCRIPEKMYPVVSMTLTAAAMDS